MDWYSKAVLPGERFDEIATYKKQLNKVPNSPLCHVSVSTWMKAAKVSYSDKSRKDRCAKVTAETVYRTVEILNQHVDSKYKIVGPKPSAQTETCLTCHGPKAADNGKGFMECLTCHDDHTK